MPSTETPHKTPTGNQSRQLKRALNLPLITLYGLGTTIGGGIYVLVGKVAERAGMMAPISFVAAALLSAFTALTFAELSSRFPKSAGEAVYVQEAFNYKQLAVFVGILVILNGCVSAAALANGFVGYLQTFIAISDGTAIILISIALGLLAAWGIGQSVSAAAIITIIEIAGLLLIIWVARDEFSTLPTRSHELMPSLDGAIWLGILSGSFLAFYAFIGFEDMVNVAEEIKDVERTLPRAIIITLVLTTLIYFFVALVAVLSIPPLELGQAKAPLSHIYQIKSGYDPAIISLIGIFAILNGGLIQMIMASRVLYGMSRQSLAPKALRFMGDISPRTQTPVKATACVVVLVCLLALSFAIESLAETTSLMILVIATLVNGALVRLKLSAKDQDKAEVTGITVPLWVPVCGLVVSLSFALMIAVSLINS
ncbi:MAG: APC family permease [Porticoccaceae bacterium]|nr:APC family permease [Porticoccaceae bacterium]